MKNKKPEAIPHSLIRCAEIIVQADYGNRIKRIPTEYGIKSVAGIADLIDRQLHHSEMASILVAFDDEFGKKIDTEEPINGADAVDFICMIMPRLRDAIKGAA